jgi:multicomponent Na+:H+ antiporter subunit E
MSPDPWLAAMTGTRNPRLFLARAALVRGLFLATLWWALSEGEAASWSIGAIVVGIATAVSLALSPPPLPRPRLLPLLRFLPFFIAKSFLGGVDVVLRACEPVPRVAPTMKICCVANMIVPERVAFTIIFALFPGTLSVRLEGETLRIHVLDETMPVMEDFAALEARLAPIFGRVTGHNAPQHQAGGET